jgi:hypothetical protein
MKVISFFEKSFNFVSRKHFSCGESVKIRDMKHEKRNAKIGKKETEAKRQVVFTIQNPPVLPRTKLGARLSPGAETLKVSSR